MPRVCRGTGSTDDGSIVGQHLKHGGVAMGEESPGTVFHSSLEANQTAERGRLAARHDDDEFLANRQRARAQNESTATEQ